MPSMREVTSSKGKYSETSCAIDESTHAHTHTHTHTVHRQKNCHGHSRRLSGYHRRHTSSLMLCLRSTFMRW